MSSRIREEAKEEGSSSADAIRRDKEAHLKAAQAQTPPEGHIRQNGLHRRSPEAGNHDSGGGGRAHHAAGMDTTQRFMSLFNNSTEPLTFAIIFVFSFFVTLARSLWSAADPAQLTAAQAHAQGIAQGLTAGAGGLAGMGGMGAARSGKERDELVEPPPLEPRTPRVRTSAAQRAGVCGHHPMHRLPHGTQRPRRPTPPPQTPVPEDVSSFKVPGAPAFRFNTIDEDANGDAGALGSMAAAQRAQRLARRMVLETHPLGTKAAAPLHMPTRPASMRDKNGDRSDTSTREAKAEALRILQAIARAAAISKAPGAESTATQTSGDVRVAPKELQVPRGEESMPAETEATSPRRGRGLVRQALAHLGVETSPRGQGSGAFRSPEAGVKREEGEEGNPIDVSAGPEPPAVPLRPTRRGKSSGTQTEPEHHDSVYEGAGGLGHGEQRLPEHHVPEARTPVVAGRVRTDANGRAAASKAMSTAKTDDESLSPHRGGQALYQPWLHGERVGQGVARAQPTHSPTKANAGAGSGAVGVVTRAVERDDVSERVGSAEHEPEHDRGFIVAEKPTQRHDDVNSTISKMIPDTSASTSLETSTASMPEAVPQSSRSASWKKRSGPDMADLWASGALHHC